MEGEGEREGGGKGERRTIRVREKGWSTGERDSTRVREIEPDRESERGIIKRERGGQT